MTEHSGDILHYLPRSSRDELWGVVCTTAGHQHVPPGTDYPVSRHPAGYHFSKGKGRVLDEFQLVYITAGRGRFESASCPPTVVEAGSMLLLFPHEWHAYSPDPEVGWDEWWVGFYGPNIERLVENGLLSRRQPLFRVGRSSGIERCYREIIETVEEERMGFQPLISGIVLHILGWVLFRHANLLRTDDPLVGKINRARCSCMPASDMRIRPSGSPGRSEWDIRGSGGRSGPMWGWRRHSISRPCGSTRPANCLPRRPVRFRRLPMRWDSRA